ncbi:DEAD/DEAH box helicase family protein [Noviherbaspirillum agri]
MLNASLNRVTEIELLDAMCGTGKSYSLFKFVTQNPHERFIYVTPMLTEVESRAAIELAKLGDTETVFHSPTGDGYKTKGDHLVDLLQAGKNVICTHTLFQQLSLEGIHAVWSREYIVIVDEELGMIEPLNDSVLPTQDRKQLLKDQVITTEADGRVIWLRDEWGNGAFTEARKLANNGGLYSNRNGAFFNVQLPVELIRAAKRVIVATYLFEGSVFQAFLAIKGIGYKPFSFEGMELRDERELKARLRDRIEFYGSPATMEKLYRQVGIPVDDLRTQASNSTFSTSWYKNATFADKNRVGNHIRNTARSMGVKVDDLIYTLPSTVVGKEGEKWNTRRKGVLKIKGFGAQSCFLHKGARATNDYAHKTAAIHAYNRYSHPAVKSYLEEQGAKVDEDSFALAELIQWFFRTAIREPNGPKVKLHIVSPRMDKLFKNWLYS